MRSNSCLTGDIEVVRAISLQTFDGAVGGSDCGGATTPDVAGPPSVVASAADGGICMLGSGPVRLVTADPAAGVGDCLGGSSNGDFETSRQLRLCPRNRDDCPAFWALCLLARRVPAICSVRWHREHGNVISDAVLAINAPR